MESFDSREAVTDLVLELLSEDEFRDGPSAGLVLQAYLRDSPELLRADRRAGPRGAARAHPLVVRLVKGAYWDHEVVEARQHGWESPVFEVKAECDRNFEALTRRLLDARRRRPPGDRRPQPALRRPRDRRQPRDRRAATATSSSRSCAASATTSSTRSPRSGLRVRTYCPVGDLVAGMAYLVRRLLENTANESFLAEQASGALDRGAAGRAVSRAAAVRQRADPRAAPRRRARGARRRAWPRSTPQLPLRVPVLIGDDRRDGDALVSTDPGDPDRVVARRADGDAEADVDAAVPRRGASARPAWARDAGRAPRRGARARRRVAARAPARARRARGPRVREAVGARPTPTSARRSTSSSTTPRGAVALDRGRDAPPGPRRAQRRCATRPRGVVAVIAPWNFPIAIPCGMAARGAGHRQRRRPQAGRAVARLRARWSSGAARGRRAAGRDRARCRARATRAPRWSADPRRPRRSPSPAAARSASRSCARPPRCPPGSATSSASSPRWAARTA